MTRCEIMVVKFGFNKVSMESGIAKDESCGVCRITKHFNAIWKGQKPIPRVFARATKKL